MTRPIRRPALPSSLTALCLLAVFAALPARAAEPVLKNNQVTESALIDALGVDEPTAASGATRGFKPAAPGAADRPAAPAKPAGPGRANLLIIFGSGSAVLTPESQKALDAVARALQSDKLAGLTFRVEGHADARGDAEANRKLSQQRAEAVVGWLVDKQGILPERLTAEGKGSAEPLNAAVVDAPENRRVTIVTVRR